MSQEVETKGTLSPISGVPSVSSKAQGAMRIRKVERHLRPWRVEGLETKCGTGRHVTFHRDLDAALDAAFVALYQDHGIVSVVVRNH